MPSEALFQTAHMIEALEVKKLPDDFLLRTFFRAEDVSWNEYVEVEIVRHKRRMAPFVHPLLPGKVEERPGRAVRVYKPPYVKPKRVSSAADFLARLQGDTRYSERSIAEKAAQLMEMDQEIDRREEWMAAQQLTEGKMTVTGDGFDPEEMDFLWSANHLLANTDLTANGWDQAGAKPWTDIKAASRRIIQDSGMTPNVLVLGDEAADLFFASDEVTSLLDTLNIVPGNFAPAVPRGGGQALATMLGLQIWSYSDWFLDENGDEQPMIPTNYAILGSTAARGTRHYGAILDLKVPAGGTPPRRFPKSWEEDDPSVRYVMVQSAPLPVLHEPDAFVRLQVTA
jgi:hypothetical protein